jgi:GxGYxYP putative glycoside hydrolase C-terminal domain/GxGYxY sequence motif in domain of unknown function N-terminal
MSFDVPGLDWSDKRVVPGFQSIQHLNIYDFRDAAQDVQLAATICAGIINRPQPRVYMLFTNDDEYWLRQLASTIPQTQAICSGDGALVELLNSYQAEIKGLIIYDPACIDSINVGTTLAGLRSGVVVSPALAQDLSERYQFPLIMDLRTFHWRSRLQAYLWAKQHLLPECASRLIAGMNPIISNGLRSFLVATRTFVYWLDSRRYFPDGHAGILSERGLMRQIFHEYAPNSLHLGWVIDEFSGIALLSHFAMAVLPSDHFNNLEVWTAIKPSSAEHVPDDTILQKSFLPAVVPSSHVYDANKVYLSFTLSDGDNIQYCQHQLLQVWNEPVRGTIPLGWTLSLLLQQSAPALGAYYQETATANDELVAGPSGAGYMYPAHWPQEHLPKFLQQTGELMSGMGMTTLEVLDADRVFGSGLPLIPKISLRGMTFHRRQHMQQFSRALALHGMRGIVSGNGFLFRGGRWHSVDKVPVCHNLGLFGSAKTTLLFIKTAAKIYKHRPLFLNVYVNAWFMGPAQIKQVMQQLGDGYTFVLPHTLLAMLAETQQHVL